MKNEHQSTSDSTPSALCDNYLVEAASISAALITNDASMIINMNDLKARRSKRCKSCMARQEDTIGLVTSDKQIYRMKGQN